MSECVRKDSAPDIIRAVRPSASQARCADIFAQAQIYAQEGLAVEICGGTFATAGEGRMRMLIPSTTSKNAMAKEM